jgi:hypothetical protein
MKRLGIISCLCVLCICVAGTAFAASGAGVSVSAAESVVTDEPGQMPMMVPFRVWVYPQQTNGVMSAGHYEYFYMQVIGNNAERPLAVPKQQAVEPIIALPEGDPAIPTN